MSLPLHGHELFRSTNLDEIRTHMSGVLCPHEVGIRDRDVVLDAQMNSLHLGDIGLNYVHYGASVWVDPGCTKDFIALQIPMSGLSKIRCGTEEIESTPDVMLVSRQDEPLRMELSAGAQLLVTRMSWPFLVDTLSALLGVSAPWPLRFELGMNVRAEPQQAWFQLLVQCYRRASQPTWIPSRRLWGPHFKEQLALGLLRAQPNNYSEILAASPLPASHRVLRQAMAVLDGSPEYSHTECSLARKLAVSARSLDAAFRSYLHTSLPGHLFHVRLRRAFVDLLEAQPGQVTVDQVARRWGFTPEGFRRCYQREFGESPEETLHR
ncbi:AraC family transcriptional regulator [Amycolatopsis acidiphila]|uniref:AraC family transcriptional regulator n=1 Tax=Amycolatopsis acidiphila TaxID=715473 RepID=A0A558AN36_9PSEU|nr:AraC family transcriptional regulator [Amycolatopsis acidiphila]TVT25677.1 AraC family transcriptional regulator [Amycolatopsis acidiphila]UIJ60433.1 AraC family transcriptional regulator [Amycolatopsis acidiphila]GHG90197.1 transcriptional regulator [Amycolatopsis acidiphila]